MSTAIQISRDTEGVRLELMDAGDARILDGMGRWTLVVEGDEYAILPDDEGHAVCHFEGSSGIPGLRFMDFRKGYGMGVKLGRFGPVEVEADIYNPQGFSAVLPPLHERPWPWLCENEGCYDVGEQIILTVAERINDLIDFSGMPIKDAIRCESRKIPSGLRRFLPVGDAEAIVRCQMAKLRLPLESH